MIGELLAKHPRVSSFCALSAIAEEIVNDT
jgi:hypothetical protein